MNRKFITKSFIPAKTLAHAELQQAGAYLNSIYCGRSLVAVREAVLKELQDDQERMNQAMLDAIKMAQLTFESGR